MDPVQNNGQQQQNQPVQDQPVGSQPRQHASPVGNAQKETEPIPQQDAFLEPTDREPLLHPELKEAGIETVKTEPQLTLEDKKAGLSLAKESILHPLQPTGVVTLPMTAGEEQKIAKSIGPTHSFRWLIEMYQKIRKKGR